MIYDRCLKLMAMKLVKHNRHIIAEISANHNGKGDNAFKIIDMAKRFGADAIKMQLIPLTLLH